MELRWAVPGLIAVGSLPRGPQDVERLKRGGIGAVLSLHPVSFLTAEAMREAGMAHRTEEVEDLSAPSPAQMDRLRALMDSWAQQGLAIYVHCYAGIGRSRTVAAAWLSLRLGSVEAAFQSTGLLQTAGQRAFVVEYFRLRASSRGIERAGNPPGQA